MESKHKQKEAMTAFLIDSKIELREKHCKEQRENLQVKVIAHTKKN